MTLALGESRRRWFATLAVALPIVLFGVVGTPPPAGATGVTTTCTLQSLDNPSEAGSPARFRFFSNNEGSIPGPTGFVTFLDDGVPFRVLEPLIPDGPTLDRSTLIIDTSSLSAGTHLISAVFVPFGLSTPCPGVPPTVSHEVRSTVSTTTVSSSVNPTTWGQSTTFTASVTKAGGVPTGSVQFGIDGGPNGSPVLLDAAGNATLTVSNLDAGTHTVDASFVSNNPATRDSAGSLAGGQVVNQAATSTSVTSAPNPAEVGVSVTVSANVTVTAPGSGQASGAVQFRADGVAIGGPVTLSGGSAQVTTSSLAIGSRAITASYGGNANLTSSSGGTTQTIERSRTVLTYDGASTADFHDPAAVRARLTRQRDGAAVSGASVSFVLGSATCAATTDGTGVASCTLVPQDPAGPAVVQASFAGDAQRQASDTSAPFTITREQTSLRLTSRAVALSGASFIASAELTEDDGAPVLAGRVVTFTLGTASCTATTDSAGRAQCAIASGALPLGPQTLTATFAQDPYYSASSATAQVIVYAFPSRGAFVIGDRVSATGTTVQFFASDWSRSNPLSSGSAPNSFKGFTGTPGAPIACGGTFTARTGDSDKPPTTIPSYMGTIVTSQVSQNGSTITGSRTSLVIVRTAGSSSSLGQGGAGTVVATIPCT